MAQLEVKNISKSFGEKQVLSQINLELKEGEIISLLGVSGAGKTTLFHIISGIMEPDQGDVLLDGERINGKAGKISYMLQKDLLLPFKTIEDNVALPLIINGMKKKQARATVQPYFSQFGLEGTQKQYPAQLSGGMKQRAALLRTYLCGTGVALLDEPFSALDTITKSALQKWYLNIMEEIKLSTIFITHDMNEAILLSDRIYLLTGTPGTISQEIVIEEPKPRSDEFPLTNRFLEYKKQIMAGLKGDFSIN